MDKMDLILKELKEVNQNLSMLYDRIEADNKISADFALLQLNAMQNRITKDIVERPDDTILLHTYAKEIRDGVLDIKDVPVEYQEEVQNIINNL